MLATLLQEAVDGGNGGNFERIAKSGLRIEIQKRQLANGEISLHGSFRKRGKERGYAGYISTEEIRGYTERLASYRPR